MSDFDEISYENLYWEPPRIKVDLKTVFWAIQNSNGRCIKHHLLSGVDLELAGDWKAVGVSRAGLEEDLREAILATIKKHEVENREKETNNG